MNYLVFDLETINSGFLPVKEGEFPPLLNHNIVSIGCCSINTDTGEVTLSNIQGITEKELVTNLLSLLSDIKPVLVTYNGRGFDIPLLFLKSIKYNLKFYNYLNYQKRYDNDHIDLCDILSNFGAVKSMKLNDILRYLNLPTKTGDGSKVQEMYQEGLIDEIDSYCLNDVKVTTLLLIKLSNLGLIKSINDDLSSFERILNGK